MPLLRDALPNVATAQDIVGVSKSIPIEALREAAMMDGLWTREEADSKKYPNLPHPDSFFCFNKEASSHPDHDATIYAPQPRVNIRNRNKGVRMIHCSQYENVIYKTGVGNGEWIPLPPAKPLALFSKLP